MIHTELAEKKWRKIDTMNGTLLLRIVFLLSTLTMSHIKLYLIKSLSKKVQTL